MNLNNPHIIGTVMRDTVRKAMLEIRKQRIIFTSQSKTSSYKPDDNDLVTSADLAAQDIYIKSLKESFPKTGIIAEENFACECTDTENNYYFTIDPLDGTKAFGRRQSYGVSTMLAFVFNGVIQAVTIGDVMTQEIFHTRPMSPNVHRIHDYETPELLSQPEASGPSLLSQYILLRKDPREHSKFVSRITDSSLPDHFKGIEVCGGSIGCMFTRLWKKEVGVIVLSNGPQTPWDALPVLGISKKLGYLFFAIGTNNLYQFNPQPFTSITKTHRETLVVHNTKAEEIKSLFNKIINA